MTIGDVQRIDVLASPILSLPLYCTNTTSAAICTPPIGEVQRIKKNLQKLLIGAAASPLSAGCNLAPIMFLYCANTVGATSLVALRLFVQNSPINWAVLVLTEMEIC
jgi:hypothetical protein